jgi:hypothetical protein
MSKDQMQDVFAVNFDFKKGEQPSSTKLTGWVKQTNSAFSDITQSIGDPWMYQSHGDRELSPEKLAQASLARIIGPSDWLSPHGASWNESCTATITLSPYRNSWSLGYPLVSVASMLTPTSSTSDVTSLYSTWGTVATWSGTGASTYFSTLKSMPEQVTESGDYHIDFFAGVITSYSMPTNSISLTITDLCMFGPGVPWATANIIPTWDDGTLCNVVETDDSGGESTYTISFPVVKTGTRATGSNLEGASWTVGYDLPAAGADATHAKYRLPYSVLSTFDSASSDPVPEGFLLLWDGSRIVPNVRFYTMDDGSGNVDPYKIKAITISDALTEGATVRIILTGTSVSESVNYLMNATRSNVHIGLTDGQDGKTLSYASPLSHHDLSDRFGGDVAYTSFDIGQASFMFRESSYPTNEHPQYLHRSGYMEEDEDGNTGNAMRGNIVFSQEVYDYSIASGDIEKNSYGLQFGNANEGAFLSFFGAKDTSSNAIPFGINGAGISYESIGITKVYGALTARTYKNAPFYLRSSTSTNDYNSGASLAFDYAGNNEMNYIKVMSGHTSHGINVNIPVNLSQASWSDELPMTPSLGNSLSPEQVREWRFRGVPYISSANNNGLIDLPYFGATPKNTKYFTSPSIVGADFLNVYSNAVFFSNQGDGNKTSFHNTGVNWFNNHSLAKPVGMYYMPEGDDNAFSGPVAFPGSHYQFITGDDTDTKLSAAIGLERTILSSYDDSDNQVCYLNMGVYGGLNRMSLGGNNGNGKLDINTSFGTYTSVSLWSNSNIAIGSPIVQLAGNTNVSIGGYIPTTSSSNTFNANLDTLKVELMAPTIDIKGQRDHGETVAASAVEVNITSVGSIDIEADEDLYLHAVDTLYIYSEDTLSLRANTDIDLNSGLVRLHDSAASLDLRIEDLPSITNSGLSVDQIGVGSTGSGFKFLCIRTSSS